MVKPITMVITLMGVGYAIALTLVIVGCAEESNYMNLLLLAPYVFTPTMVIFIREDSEDSDFWLQFAFFVIAFSLVCAFAMPLVFWDTSSYGLVGLSYGLGSSFTLYVFMIAAGYFHYKPDDGM